MVTISINGTTKLKPRLDFDGQSYIKDQSTSTKTYWRCIKYSTDLCHSCLHICNVTNDIVKAPTPHLCETHGSTLELQDFDQQIIYTFYVNVITSDAINVNCFISTYPIYFSLP
jgi:hypothetical protein